MATISVKEGKFPIKAYLKADSFSQHFVMYNDQGESTDLVTHDMFWGKASGEGLYLDYEQIKNRKISVTEGISQNNGSQTFRAHLCDDWIQEHIYDLNESKVFVLQGYAGCGKTTFMNHLLRKRKIDVNSFYIDIGKIWAYPQEPYMFFKEALIEFDRYMDNIIRNKYIREEIWEKFIDMGKDMDISILDLQLPDVIPKFIEIKNNSTWDDLRLNIHGYLNETFGSHLAKEKNGYIWHNYGQTQTIVALFILMICAKFLVENKRHLSSESYILVFDNLDVITDPAIPAENVVNLWGVMHRFMDYKSLFKKKTQNDLPHFGIFVTVRKVLYSHITSHLPDLEMQSNYNQYFINVCDISDLYLSQDILEHRISYWIKNINDTDTVYKLKQLSEIRAIHSKNALLEYEDDVEFEESYEIHNSINLDAFFKRL